MLRVILILATWRCTKILAAEDVGDLYDILDVTVEATEKEIKSAYRKLSLKHHPDKGGDAMRFKEITRAYEILSDGEKRALYDVGGMTAVDEGSSGRTDPWGRPIGVRRGDNVEVTVNVPLEDMYKGGMVSALRLRAPMWHVSSALG